MWEKIVLNLLSNALKFTFEGEIEVALRPSGGQAILTVRDTGTGVPAEQLPLLFDRFHRVPGVRSRTYEGTGIGLSLVQELVKLHGGTVTVSSAEHRGTVFDIAVPFGSAHLPQDRLATPRKPGSTTAGAEAFVQVARLLRERWEVEAVADGAAALARARQAPPDLVLTDIMMPGMDGFALLQALRADPSTHAIPVIFLSARAGEESSIEGLSAGADDYLIKPFSARELLARVSTHLALSRLRLETTPRNTPSRTARSPSAPDRKAARSSCGSATPGSD